MSIAAGYGIGDVIDSGNHRWFLSSTKKKNWFQLSRVDFFFLFFSIKDFQELCSQLTVPFYIKCLHVCTRRSYNRIFVNIFRSMKHLRRNLWRGSPLGFFYFLRFTHLDLDHFKLFTLINGASEIS